MRSPNERLLDVINKSSSIQLSVADLEVQNVRLNDNGDIPRNTRCFLLSRKNGKLMGTKEFFYNRMDLGKVFHGTTPVVLATHGERVTYQVIADRLAKQYGIELYGSDVVPSGEILLTKFPHPMTLTAKEGHPVIQGAIDVLVSDVGTDLGVAMGVTSLSGLNPPNGTFEKIQGCLYSWNWVAQPELAAMLRALPIGARVQVEAAPYLTALDGKRTWEVTNNTVPANLHMATLQYRGNRDNHPDYGTGQRRDEIAVIRLFDSLNADIGGDLVIGLP